MQNDVLHRRWFDGKTGCESLQVCIPEQLKGAVQQELHDQCGHLSVRKTTDNVRKRFYWIGYTTDIELYCLTCHTCGSRNGPIPRARAPMQSIKTGYPLERIQIDILGPLPETNKGKKHVAVVVDLHTKWPEAYALPHQEAITRSPRLSWTTSYAASVALLGYSATRAAILSLGHSVAYAA